MTDTGLAARSIKRASAIAESLAARGRDGKDGAIVEAGEPTTIVKTEVVEKLPDEYIERLQFIARKFDALSARLEALETEGGSLSATDANSLVQGFGARLDQTVEEKIADALGDIRARLTVIEQRESPQVADQVQKLGKTVHAFGEFIRSVESTVEEKSGELERKYAEIARHIGGVEGRMGKLASVVHGLADVVKHADVEPIG